MENIKAKEIVSTNFEKVDYNASIGDVIKKFKKRKVLYVFKDKELKGVLLDRKVIRPRIDPKAKIKKFVYLCTCTSICGKGKLTLFLSKAFFTDSVNSNLTGQ